MAQRGFADQPLEEEDLVRQPDGVAMRKVDLDLARAAFLQDAVNLESLGFGKIIDVIDDLAVFIDRTHRIGLLAGSAAARPAHGGHDRHVGIKIARGQEEFHLGRDDRPPAFGVVQFNNAAQHIARGGGHGVAGLILRVMDHLQGDVRRPGGGGGRGKVRDQDHVGLGELARRVVGPFAGDRLQEDRVRQEETALLGEFRRRHRLAARHAGDIADDAFHLVNAASRDIVPGGLGQLFGPFGHDSHSWFHPRGCLKKSAIRSAMLRS